MASGMDIWGVIASAIGVLSTIQIIWTIIYGRLPNQCIRLFEETLKDTETLLDSVSEEGLFDDDGHYVTHAKTRISNICKRLEGLREESFEAKTYKQELKQWWRGLSGRISVCNDELKELRAEISVTSNEARAALAQQRQNGNAGSNEPALVSAGEASDVFDADPIPRGELRDASPANPSPNEARAGGSILPIQLAENCPTEDECEDRFGAPTPSTLDPLKSCVVEAVHCCLHSGRHSLSHPRSNSADTLLPYRQQSISPSYVTSVCRCPPASVSNPPAIPMTSLLSRCTAGDSARATRKLIKAYRRSLMVHSVPWKSQEAQHSHRGASAAASAWAANRPSSNTRHWKFLEERSMAPLRTHVIVLSHKAIVDTAHHAPCT